MYNIFVNILFNYDLVLCKLLYSNYICYIKVILFMEYSFLFILNMLIICN